MLAVEHSAKSLGPTGCFISAAVFLLLAVGILVWALHPRWRQTMRWTTFPGARMSLRSAITLAIYFVIWSAACLAQALEYAPIQKVTGWILVTGFGFVWLTATVDALADRKQ